MNKHYYKKYLKYKDKYLELKAGAVTQSSDKIMPFLSCGTETGHISKLKNKILVALNSGYKHIDIKSRYSNLLDASVKDYLIEIKEGIKESRILRKELWITWNGGQIITNENNIENVIKFLECDYIDTIIGNNGDLVELVLLRDKGLVMNLAVENIYDFEKIKELQGLYGINTLQIQAHIKNDKLIRDCNAIGVKVQLYAISSSINKYSINEYESGNFDILEKPEIKYVINNIIRYYMVKYIKTDNVIIIESDDYSYFPTSMKIYNEIINGEELIDIDRIDTLLKDIGNNLPDMGSGTLYK